MKVSIIVPVYNTEAYLERCLKSLVNQTLKDIEIICIDDGSKDNSVAILKKYSQLDERIKIIEQENLGVSVARNNGLKLATGEYIGFVDSDDWIDLDFYEKLYNAAKKYDADISACGIKRLRTYKWKYHLKIDAEEVTEDKNRKFQLCDVPDKCYVWNKIYRFQTLKDIGIEFEPDVYYEDRCYMAEVLIKSNKLVVLPDVYYNYWTNPNSIVKTTSPKKVADYEYVEKNLMAYLKEQDVNLDHHHYEIKKFKFLGLTIFKIKYYKHKKQIIIFNQIKFWVYK